MSTLKLHSMFNPDTVTVIGASNNPGSIGTLIMKNLVDGGFKGRIIPVNPAYEEVMGFQCFPDVESIYHKLEALPTEGAGKTKSTLSNLAVIATPINTVSGIVASCGRAAMDGAVIIASETGSSSSDEYRHDTEEPSRKSYSSSIKEAITGYGTRILGHNSLGIINTGACMHAGCTHIAPIPGKIAFICQSPTVSSYVLDLSIRENIGFSHFVSLGEMVDVDFADMIDYLGSLHSVESILMYVESITNIRSFMSAARSVSRVKPIIAVKSGRTDDLAEKDAIYDAAFRRAGILRVHDFQEMFDCAQFVHKQKRPRGAKLTIITNSEGAGAMAVDALASYGMEPARISDAVLEQINEFLPGEINRYNPVNVPPDAAPEIYLRTARICADSLETDALLLLACPTTSLDPEEMSFSLGEYLKTAKCPVFTAWMGGAYGARDPLGKRTGIEKLGRVFSQAGVIAYDTPERGVKAFANLCRYAKNLEMLQQIPIRKDIRLVIDFDRARKIIDDALKEKEYAVLTDVEATELIKSYGIPANRAELAASLEDAIAVARNMGYPVMMRVCSRDIPHRSSAGSAMLNLTSWKDVESAFNTIMESAGRYAPQSVIEGVMIQPMVTKSDYELSMASRLDRNFGPVITFGLGGVISDIIRDTATALPPFDNLLARRLIEDTKISRVFKGYRYIPPLDSEQLEDMLIRLSRLVTDFPEIEEISISPVMISEGEPVATGVEAIVRKSSVKQPMHLVISSYPFEYETEERTIDDEKIFIRPIMPSDAPLMVEHFLSLSPRSVYFRFFTPMKQLSQSMLIRLTQIDYDREIALIALIGEGEEQVMAGVARVMFEPDGNNAEFSVALSDKWHGKGIGASLLKRCLRFSAQKGLKRVWGVVLAENRQMLKLAKKLGFNIKYISGSSEYELEIDLAKLEF